jgi:tetratricopeptide (TPR) repeat protein
MGRERSAEDLEFEISFYEGILEEDPDFVPALIPLADDYTRVGRYEDGLALDERLSALKPHDPLIHYNLACSYALTGEADESIAALGKAVDLGYDDLDWMERDEDLAAVRKLESFRNIVDTLRDRKSSTR